MPQQDQPTDLVLREALEANGQRFTEQRAAVYRFLASTDKHPTADEVFLAVRSEVPVISSGYRLQVAGDVGGLRACHEADLRRRLGPLRRPNRPPPPRPLPLLFADLRRGGHLPSEELDDLEEGTDGFQVTGYRLELTGYCSRCGKEQAEA
jgi:Fur family transcriptional regulator, peroxide stress response regulator